MRAKEKYISKPLAELLRRILAWDPQNRPSSRTALTQVWKPIVTQMKEAEGNRMQKQEEKKMNVTGAKDQRVRVRSPDSNEYVDT